MIVSTPIEVQAAENSRLLAYLQRECGDSSKRRDLEDVYNNLVMENPGIGTEMRTSLTILKNLWDSKKATSSENEFYQIEKGWRLLFQLRCRHLYTPVIHQKNRERLQYIDSKINLSPRSAQSLSSAMTGSPIRTSGDAYALLVRQINVLLTQDSCPTDFSMFYDLISDRRFHAALLLLCFEDVKRVLPFAKILLDAKSKLNLDMKEINKAFVYVAKRIEKHGDRSLYDLLVRAGADENSRDQDHSAKEYLEQAIRVHPHLSRGITSGKTNK